VPIESCQDTDFIWLQCQGVGLKTFIQLPD
jgi:hypothetical protein